MNITYSKYRFVRRAATMKDGREKLKTENIVGIETIEKDITM